MKDKPMFFISTTSIIALMVFQFVLLYPAIKDLTKRLERIEQRLAVCTTTTLP